jgi:hypothetical protein
MMVFVYIIGVICGFGIGAWFASIRRDEESISMFCELMHLRNENKYLKSILGCSETEPDVEKE